MGLRAREGTFAAASSWVQSTLTQEIARDGATALLDHVRLAGAIPESYGHDTREEKLYSKYTDTLLALAFRSAGMSASILTERADAADVEVVARDFSFVADAKAFRLSRTAKNQKDFKVQAMDGWKHGKPFAIVVAPLYQLPARQSQIYQQAIMRDVCILTYAHIALLIAYASVIGPESAQAVLHEILRSISRLNPTKDAVAYWRAVNDTMLAPAGRLPELWKTEQEATVEALHASKTEALDHLASERERIMRLSREEAVEHLIRIQNFDNRVAQITRVVDTHLLRVV